MAMIDSCQTCYADLNGKKHCLVCRRNERYSRVGVDVGAACTMCGVKTKLMVNGNCNPCLKLQGLKQCKGCHEIKLAYVEFGDKKGTCNDCLRPSQKEEPCVLCGNNPRSRKALICHKCESGMKIFGYDARMLRAAADLLDD